MTDNLQGTPGSGLTIRSVDIGGGVQVQLVGLVDQTGAALALATAAGQTTAQTSLTSLDGKLSPPLTPAAVAAFTATTDTAIFATGSRKGLVITNEGAGDLYVLYGTWVASVTNYTFKLRSGDVLTDTYQGAVRGLFASAGTARCQELT